MLEERIAKFQIVRAINGAGLAAKQMIKQRKYKKKEQSIAKKVALYQMILCPIISFLGHCGRRGALFVVVLAAGLTYRSPSVLGMNAADVVTVQTEHEQSS